METVMRNEYPRPQMVRDDWQNLNGLWEFEFDFSKSMYEKRYYEEGEFTKQINVPFCPESKLSGIGFVDFIPAAWYRRKFNITEEQAAQNVLLHFGAVDYFCMVFINGKQAGSHKGGYSSFCIDITEYVCAGENTVVVYVEDDTRNGKQPKGKQSSTFYSAQCDYTRTTGIWQTVWLEFVPKNYIKSYTVIPDLNSSSVDISVKLSGCEKNLSVKITASFGGSPTGSAEALANGATASVRINLTQKHVWDVGKPNLYDLKISLQKDGAELDAVSGYFGLRNVYLHDNVIYLNNRPLFQRLVLDQGFYPDGIYTAPSDEALKKDIELSMVLGFNGARLHEKAFEERFLYHADKLGYLVWGEHANWGLDISNPEGAYHFLPEWLVLVERDFNHPSIVGWCPFNETWDNAGRKQYDGVLSMVYLATKAIDNTRPVIDTSGNFHVMTDIYDVHDYDQNVESFAGKYKNLKKGEAHETHPKRQSFGGQPYFVSEYGGTWWSGKKGNSWGYGKAPASEAEFLERYTGLTEALLLSEGICAFCYTQLYDVEQEQNGLYTYERTEKFSKETYDAIHRVNSQKAAIEL